MDDPHDPIPRILAIKSGEVEPLFEASPIGRPSPSRSLLLERLDVTEEGQQTHTLIDHVLTLFLKPTILHHARNGGCSSQFPIEAGQVVICVRDDSETLEWSRPLSMFCMRINEQVIGETARTLRIHGSLRLVPTMKANDPRLTSLLWALEAERAREYPSGQLFLDSLEICIAALLVNSHSSAPAAPASSNGGLAPGCLRRVLDFMHDHIGEQVKLLDLAATARLSLSHFSHQFRVSMGMSPYKYMLALRIDHGKKLLRNKDLSILDVALSSGFESQQHFATVFRRLVGVIPSTYRHQL